MRILVVKLHAIGDLVIATPAFRLLRGAFPDAVIDLLTTDWTEPAARNNPCFDEIISVPNRAFFHPDAGSPLILAKLWRRLRRSRYDFGVLFHRSNAVNRFIALSGIARRFRFGFETFGDTVYLDEARHSVLTACELAHAAVKRIAGRDDGFRALDELQLEWQVSESESVLADEVLANHGLQPRGFAAFFPGGGVNPNDCSLVRRWPAKSFVELAIKTPLELGLTPVLLGGSGDRQVCEQIAAGCSNCLNLTGEYDLRVTAALTRRAAVVFANDSGPLHISAAVGAPTVGIFGPTGAELKLPPGEHVRAVTLKLPCSPCFFGIFKGCIFNAVRCMEELTVDSVLECARELLAKRRSLTEGFK